MTRLIKVWDIKKGTRPDTHSHKNTENCCCLVKSQRKETIYQAQGCDRMYYLLNYKFSRLLLGLVLFSLLVQNIIHMNVDSSISSNIQEVK